MAFPKHSRFRRITVGVTIYRWQAYFGDCKGSLIIYGPESSGRALQIHSAEWFDVWLSHPYHNPKRPMLVSPAFARNAIEFGLLHGWNPQERGTAHILGWSEGKFQETREEEPSGCSENQNQGPCG